MVSSSVVPSFLQLADELPHVDAAARVETGRGLVEEQDVGPPDEARREVEAPAHAARVGLGGAIGGVGQPEALEHLAAAATGLGLRQVVEAPDQLEVLEAGQVLVDRGALPREPDAEAQLLGVAHDVEAVDLGAAAVGASSVVRMRTAVVLPAPLGPSMPSTVPLCTSRSTPLSASTSPKCLTSCSVLMMGEDMVGNPTEPDRQRPPSRPCASAVPRPKQDRGRACHIPLGVYGSNVVATRRKRG